MISVPNINKSIIYLALAWQYRQNDICQHCAFQVWQSSIPDLKKTAWLYCPPNAVQAKPTSAIT